MPIPQNAALILIDVQNAWDKPQWGRRNNLDAEVNITTLFITGFMTNGCVETTARMAGDLGFKTHVVSDGTATFDRLGPDGVLHPAEEVHTVKNPGINARGLSLSRSLRR